MGKSSKFHGEAAFPTLILNLDGILQLMVANWMLDQVSMMTNQRFVLSRQGIGPRLVKKVICVSSP